MKTAVKIVTFYDDGTFEESIPTLTQRTQPQPPTVAPPVYHPPQNPWVQPWPSYPPYTVTCKMEDGSIKTFETGPIMAQVNT